MRRRAHPRELRLDRHDRAVRRRRTGAEITLRINPGFGHGHSQKTNTGGKQAKHGIWHAQIPECVALAAKHRLAVTGLHVHIGSGTDMEHLSHVCGALEKAAETVGPSVASISVGGGLPTVYRESDSYVDLAAYFALCDAARKRLQEKFGHPVRLEIEPGRYLVAESGYLLAEIRAVKRQDDNVFYLIDAGFNNLARPILYGAYHPMSIAPAGGRGSCRAGATFGNARRVSGLAGGRGSCRAGATFGNARRVPGLAGASPSRSRGSRRDVSRGDRRRAALRIGRYLHAGRRRFRLQAKNAAGRGGGNSDYRMRGRLRFRNGLELQLQTAGRRSAPRRRQAPPHSPPPNLRGPRAQRAVSQHPVEKPWR